MKISIILLALFSTAVFAQQKSSFTDSRDGKAYKTTKIGEQVWMAENLNYKVNGSKCYGEGGIVYDEDDEIILSSSEIQANCNKYGRLYDWVTAMKACPKGWHLPSKKEWNVLINFAGGDDKAGKNLKAVNGWNSDEVGKSDNGTDIYGFSALPGGTGDSDGSFDDVGDNGYWWSNSEYGSNAYCMYMDYDGKGAYYYNIGKNFLFSVRCVRD